MAGQVVAQGSPGEVSLRSAAARHRRVRMRSVPCIDGVVTAIDAERKLAELQLGRRHAAHQRARRVHGRWVQSCVFSCWRATSFSRQRRRTALSVRNAIEGVVEEIAQDDDDAALVRVDIGGEIGALARDARPPSKR